MPPAGQNKTEKPTSKRISTARGQGQVANSEELLSAISIIVLVATTTLMGPRFTQWSILQMKEGFSCNTVSVRNMQTFNAFVNGKIVEVFSILAPFFIAMMLTGIIANIAIHGYNFTLTPLKWKLSELDPIKGFSKLFSLSSIVKLIFSIVKIVFVTTIVSFYVRDRIYSITTFQWASSGQLLTLFSKLILGAAIRLCIGLLIIGIIDLIYQKWKYTKDLMMSKQEVKDETKNRESPPQVKQKLRQLQIEMTMRRMLQDVPKANVVLVNPTHVAVALKYDPDSTPAPVVVAKGGDHICEKIKEVARAYGVPIIRRPALARTLFATVKLGQVVPDSLFATVAEVLALIYRLRHNR